jgi:hypothetical protein
MGKAIFSTDCEVGGFTEWRFDLELPVMDRQVINDVYGKV